MNCPIDGMEMKLIPAGISKKTNRPYNAFYKCQSCGKGITAAPTPPTYSQKPLSPQMDVAGKLAELMITVDHMATQMHKVVEWIDAQRAKDIPY